MKRKCLADAGCPVARALDAIGDWWSLLIVRAVWVGKRRFCEIQKSLGTARNILTTRLQKLETQGVLERVPASDGSAYQEYALTEKGRGLYLVLVALHQWGEAHLTAPGEREGELVDARDGAPLRPLTLHAHDGRPLGPDDLRVA